MRKKYASVRSHDRADCGPAALATVAKHYGLHISLARARALVGTDAQGTELEQIRIAAGELGFDASAGSAKPDVLDTLPLPAIVHFTQLPRGHFVVVHAVNAVSVTIADPERGIVRMDRDEFISNWSRGVVLLAPSEEFVTGPPSPTPIRLILKVAGLERRLLFQSVLCAAAITLLGFGMAFFIKLVLDRVIPQSDTGLMRTLGMGILGVLGARALFEFVRQYLLAQVGRRVELHLMAKFLGHLVSLPISFFDRRNVGDMSARISDVSSVRAAVTGPVLLLFIDILMLTGCIAFMLSNNATLTITTLAILPVLVVVTITLQRPLVRVEREVRGRASQIYNKFIETVTNIRVIKAFSAEDKSIERFDEQFVRMQDSRFRSELLSALLGSLSTFLSMAISVVLLWVGASMVVAGDLTVGELMFFSALLGFFLNPAHSLAMSVTMLRQAAVGMERLVEIQSLDSDESSDSPKTVPKQIRGEVKLEKVSFAYRAGRPVLTDIDLHVRAGESLVIAGETGSGKTSIASLIMTFYSANNGHVLVDGVDIREYDRRKLLRHMGVVLQDPSLLSGTICENIAMGDSDAPFDRIQDAARLAAAHDFILDLPRQYEYDVGDGGVALSSGQRQRVAIARALLRNPAILILDEATSNLDANIEARVIESVLSSRKNRTTIIITHRLSIARRVDRVVLVDQGRIAEIGTHEELLSKGALYNALWTKFISDESDAGDTPRSVESKS